MSEEKEPKKRDDRISEKAEEFRAKFRGIFPPEFRQHMLAARKEILLAVRTLIDERIESLERAEKASARKATKIPVE